MIQEKDIAKKALRHKDKTKIPVEQLLDGREQVNAVSVYKVETLRESIGNSLLENGWTARKVEVGVQKIYGIHIEKEKIRDAFFRKVVNDGIPYLLSYTELLLVADLIGYELQFVKDEPEKEVLGVPKNPEQWRHYFDRNGLDHEERTQLLIRVATGEKKISAQQLKAIETIFTLCGESFKQKTSGSGNGEFDDEGEEGTSTYSDIIGDSLS